MDNKQNYQANITLPPLGGETVRSTNETHDTQSIQENLPNAQPAEQAMPLVDLSAINFTPPTKPVSAQSTSSTTPVISSTSDVEDKKIPAEWIVKAKNIIATTKLDPRMQTNEINKLKADFMKENYGLEIKIPDDE